MESQTSNDQGCPAEGVLKLLAGKWKPQILRLALNGPIRFNHLLKQLAGSNKQSIYLALKDLEDAGVLVKEVIKLKPLHIEYTLSDKGRAMVPIFRSAEDKVTWFHRRSSNVQSSL